ncbi:MAG TPA: protein translocase subunit SecD [Oligoflexia bacterium]|nr:protein translocase subunit SecD [Oligoflexia bacterium]HMR24122.1 protein translocase subunit SecD [Oligoflexia bacterium]
MKMSSAWKWKASVAALTTLLAIYFVLPSFLSETTLEQYKSYLPKSKINLGLDLQGGIHMVLGVDVNRVLLDEAENYATEIKELLDRENILYESVSRDFNSSIIKIKLNNPSDFDKFEDIFYSRINAPGQTVLDVRNASAAEGTFEVQISSERKGQIEKQTISQALETLRNRIDEFGVTEPSIQAQGSDRIVVQLPGLEDPQRAKSVLGQTAQLSFMIVDDDSFSQATLEEWVKEADETLEPGYDIRSLNRFLNNRLPDNRRLLFKDNESSGLAGNITTPILVQTDKKITGEMLDHAQIGFDENNWPEVHLRYNMAGTQLLDEISGKNVGRRMAIVLDNKVYSDPVLQGRISDGKPRITFGSIKSRSETFAEAKDLAVILRAGALPAPVEILETRSVGPSLGRDSIEHGFNAIVLGVILVVVFMAIYYKLSGLAANAALIINITFILACLAMINGTLTLPGIAGILISIGMAVDANVIIYERIREELLNGKSIRDAVAQGYERAHITIVDSNITTVITAVILWYFGSGPIKGFAITLIFGLIANYFTALTFTRLFFEWILNKFQPKRLSI